MDVAARHAGAHDHGHVGVEGAADRRRHRGADVAGAHPLDDQALRARLERGVDEGPVDPGVGGNDVHADVGKLVEGERGRPHRVLRRVGGEAELGQMGDGAGLGVGEGCCGLAPGVGEEAQRAGGGYARVELAEALAESGDATGASAVAAASEPLLRGPP